MSGRSGCMKPKIQTGIEFQSIRIRAAILTQPIVKGRLRIRCQKRLNQARYSLHKQQCFRLVRYEFCKTHRNTVTIHYDHFLYPDIFLHTSVCSASIFHCSLQRSGIGRVPNWHTKNGKGKQSITSERSEAKVQFDSYRNHRCKSVSFDFNSIDFLASDFGKLKSTRILRCDRSRAGGTLRASSVPKLQQPTYPY